MREDPKKTQQNNPQNRPTTPGTQRPSTPGQDQTQQKPGQNKPNR